MDKDPWNDLNRMFFDRDGKELSMREWVDLRMGGENKYARVATDEVGPYWISTVWLGLDMGYSFLKGGPPLVFETAVFSVDKHHLVEVEERYATEKQAVEGHKRIVGKYSKLAKEPDEKI